MYQDDKNKLIGILTEEINKTNTNFEKEKNNLITSLDKLLHRIDSIDPKKSLKI